ncbi:MAG: hypothetical protein KKD38_02900, partial [Candidatus Delongbacteria bacterium]|nr:hypothetical protein [Candidatus Delongbacteria bacterium]
ENCTGVDSYSQILCGEYNIPSGYPMKYFENLKDLENDFKIVSENVINGEDAIIVIEASEENCKFIINEMVKEDTEINYLPLSQLVGLIK